MNTQAKVDGKRRWIAGLIVLISLMTLGWRGEYGLYGQDEPPGETALPPVEGGEPLPEGLSGFEGGEPHLPARGLPGDAVGIERESNSIQADTPPYRYFLFSFGAQGG